MKLPADLYIYRTTKDKMREAWSNAAVKMSLEYGVYIEFCIDEDVNENISRIYFKAMGHEFDNLKTLRKALRNKAFV